MSDTIFVDPEVANAAVIEVGGICYRRLGESNQPPTVTAVGSAYVSCSHCDDPPDPGICDVTAFDTGQEEDNDRDQKWRVNGSPAYVVSQSAWGRSRIQIGFRMMKKAWPTLRRMKTTGGDPPKVGCTKIPRPFQHRIVARIYLGS
jgi:hypothetical protein